jgi:hypothetical protein
MSPENKICYSILFGLLIIALMIQELSFTLKNKEINYTVNFNGTCYEGI